jgi:hypothetical protein
MTLHYHGTPITPLSVLETLAGECFCVSYAHPEQVKRCHEIGQSVMLDNGAYTLCSSGELLDWRAFYRWAEPWLECRTTWAVIPDMIEGTEEQNRELILRCALPAEKVAPVWHLHESLDHLAWLCDQWPRVCFGSSGAYSIVGSPAWHARIQDALEACWGSRPQIHMLRGMKCSRMNYPFASVDSTDVARNHCASKRGPLQARLMAETWDSIQCPIGVTPPPPRAQEWIA